MIDRSDDSLTIPNATRVVAALIAVLIFYGGSRTILITGEAPLLLPVCAAGLSVIFLFGINVSTDPVVSLARLGFHVGLFAYFLSFPVLYPETIEPGFSDGVHQTVGW